VYKARVFLALAKRILVAKGPDPFDQLGVRPLIRKSLNLVGTHLSLDQIGVRPLLRRQ